MDRGPHLQGLHRCLPGLSIAQKAGKLSGSRQVNCTDRYTILHLRRAQLWASEEQDVIAYGATDPRCGVPHRVVSKAGATTQAGHPALRLESPSTSVGGAR